MKDSNTVIKQAVATEIDSTFQFYFLNNHIKFCLGEELW